MDKYADKFLSDTALMEQLQEDLKLMTSFRDDWREMAKEAAGVYSQSRDELTELKEERDNALAELKRLREGLEELAEEWDIEECPWSNAVGYTAKKCAKQLRGLLPSHTLVINS